MNIYTVRDNLKNTIAGKEEVLEEYQKVLPDTDGASQRVLATTIRFLEINIDELKKILTDIEVCCTQYSELGWQVNPERMGQ